MEALFSTGDSARADDHRRSNDVEGHISLHRSSA
jgi:hypothetical protein